MYASSQTIPKRQIVPQLQATKIAGMDYALAVEQFYAELYRFAFGLTGSESDAVDLTQNTYQVLLTENETFLDTRKVKIKLHTTLYQQFLGRKCHATRLPDKPVESAGWELPTISATQIESIDNSFVVAALQQLEEKFRSPLTIFYQEELSYKEMAVVLGLPIDTIMSRLYRGKKILRKCLQSTVATLPHTPGRATSHSPVDG